MNMKPILIKHRYSNFIKCAAMSFILTFSVSAHAEDIEIYNNVFDAGSSLGNSPEELNPNILFILDNSGSMKDLRLDNISYDSTQDYGNSPSGYVYLYNRDLEFEGVYFSPAQNQCQSQKEWVVSNSDRPLFDDKFVQ
jgi:hypothetical protein